MALKNVFIRHFPALLCGLLVAAWVTLPSVLFFQRTAGQFQGIYPELNGDRLYYHTRIHEVLDGHPAVNRPYFFEYKDVLYPQATGAERFIDALTRIFSTSLQQLQLVLDFVAPFLIFLLSYALFYKLAPHRLTAIVLPFILFFIIPADLAKPINPQITFPLLLLFLLLWMLMIQKTIHRLWYALGAGVVLGLLFLTYFFHWSFLVVLVGLYVIGLLMKKEFKTLPLYGVLFGVAILVGIPYFIQIFQGMGAPFHAETAVRVGVYHSYFPESLPRLAVAVVWFLFFAWFVRLYKIEKQPMTLVVASFLLANILYPNHQIITHTIIQNANHWSFMPLFIYALTLHYFFSVVHEKNLVRASRWLLAVAVILFLIPVVRFATFTYYSTVHNLVARDAETAQRYGIVIGWINQNTQSDEVIFSDTNTMRLIPAYTAANVYYDNYAMNLPGSDREVAERALLSHFFDPAFFEHPTFGMDESTRILWTQPAQSERSTHRLHDFFRVSYEKQYNLERERALIDGVYKDLQKEGWSVDVLKRYHVDYIMWDKRTYPDWHLEQFDALERIADINDFSVWRFVTSS